MNFIWIDDSPGRVKSSQNLADETGVNCRFINVSNKKVEEEIKDLLLEDEPDLIIIDHNLINATKQDEQETTKLIRIGSSAASIIRQQWKTCPIVCVSGISAANVDSQEKNIYEEMFPIENISNYYSEILSIADSFKRIKVNIPKDTTELMQLLGCPETEFGRMKAIIPKNLKENFHDGGLVVEISNWVRKTLLTRPGFLYDKLWSSTLLGLNLQGFEMVEHLFNDAKYKGIFANDDNPHWWKADLVKILGEVINQPGLPAYRGRLLEGITEKHYSRCYVTDEPFPETVAYIDGTSNSERQPMKLKETALHEGYEKLLFFDDIRLMVPAQ